MIIAIPNENSTIKWKYKDTDDWTIAEVSDLIKAYEEQRPQGEWIYHGLDNCLWGQMECPFCHRRSNSDADFCQYCGASMKGAIKDE